MVDRLGTFSKEVTRVAKQVGTDGILGAQANVQDVSGVWLELTNVVNTMANNLTDQVREIAKVTTAVAKGDLEQVINVKAEGEIKELKITINQMVETLRVFSTEVTRIAREVGTEGRLRRGDPLRLSAEWCGEFEAPLALLPSLLLSRSLSRSLSLSLYLASSS